MKGKDGKDGKNPTNGKDGKNGDPGQPGKDAKDAKESTTGGDGHAHYFELIQNIIAENNRHMEVQTTALTSVCLAYANAGGVIKSLPLSDGTSVQPGRGFYSVSELMELQGVLK